MRGVISDINVVLGSIPDWVSCCFNEEVSSLREAIKTFPTCEERCKCFISRLMIVEYPSLHAAVTPNCISIAETLLISSTTTLKLFCTHENGC